MKMLATLSVNGRNHDTIIEPHMTLADVLRDKLRLTGTKRACTGGNCGACTVLVDDAPVCSCITLAVSVRDRKIETVEGLAAPNGELSALQGAFVRNNAAQCGFCTSGMLMTAEALLRKTTRITRQEAQATISGNICRCTGYVKILDAIMEAATELQAAQDAERAS